MRVTTMNDEKRIDEAFVLFGEHLLGYTEIVDSLGGPQDGFRMSVEELTVETPVELDIQVDGQGRLELGCVPPLYHLTTSVEPVFHRLRFTVIQQQSGSESGISSVVDHTAEGIATGERDEPR